MTIASALPLARRDCAHDLNGGRGRPPLHVPRSWVVLTVNTSPAPSLRVLTSVMTGDARASSLGLPKGLVARLSAFDGLLRFGLVGLSGMAVNLVVLAVLMRLTSRVPATRTPALAETVATQVAIVWNFALTEAWVFRPAPALTGRLGRMAGFWSVSMAALAVQLPLSHLLDAALKIGYVAATAAALVILMSARFALCRALLYRGPSVAREGRLR